MGACVSSHKKTSAVKNMSSGSEKHDSPVKEKVMQVVNGNNVAVKPHWPLVNNNSRDFGSKEETFFDSQAWLESDCESDFMSVNGEFTPSRGNTPLHHDFLNGTPPVKGGLPIFPAGSPPMKGGGPVINDDKSSVTSSHPSPIKKKKRLSELFRESIREDHNLNEENGEPTNENGAVGSLKGVAVHGIGSKSKRERWVEIVQVNNCLPRVLSSCRPVTHQQTQE
ncbi:hypothetical protein Tco_0964417 [Tanacetum coccineum]